MDSTCQSYLGTKTGDLVRRLSEIQGKAKRLSTNGESSSANLLQHDEVIQLPLWPEPTRGVPNGVLRSALFGAIKKGPRRYMEREPISALNGIEIHYTGQRLDQDDLDVWINILHVARLQAMGQQSRFTAYAMLKMLRKTDTGKNRKTLHKRLLRLKANSVEVKQGRFTYIGSLICEGFKDDVTHEYVIVLNPTLRQLFESDQFTQIDWNVRHTLCGKPLALWLHGFYASHAKVYPYKVATLHGLCGSEAVRMDHYKQDLKKALDALSAACAAWGQAFSYDILGELVHVKKKGSAAQRRNIVKKDMVRRSRML